MKKFSIIAAVIITTYLFYYSVAAVITDRIRLTYLSHPIVQCILRSYDMSSSLLEQLQKHIYGNANSNKLLDFSSFA